MADISIPEYVILAAVSAASGLIGGMSGLALGTMRLPVMLFLGIDPLVAAGTNMGVGFLGSVAGSWEHLRSRRIVFRIVLLLGLPTIAGAFIGAKFADVVPIWLLLFCVSGLIVWAAFNLIVRAVTVQAVPNNGPGEAERPQIESEQGDRVYLRLTRDGAVGLGIGILGGAVGLILAMLRMPTLINLMKLSPGQAVGTNTAIGVLIGLSGTGGHLINGNISWPLLAVMGGAASVCFFLGAMFTGAVSPARLRILIGVVLLALAPISLVNGISELVN